MGFIANILTQILELIIVAIIQVIVAVVLPWLARHFGQAVAEVRRAVGALFHPRRGRGNPPPAPARDGHRLVTCAACGARVPRRKFCSNCGLRLRRAAVPLAQK
jgi:hypothetical protein